MYIYVYILFIWFGRDPGGWHHGASGSRRHRSARVSSPDPGDRHHGASGSRRHRSARVSSPDPGDRHETDGFQQRFLPSGTPDRHAIGRGYARRTGTLRALLAAVGSGRADGTTGVGESHPGSGLRQQRRVHAVLGGLECGATGTDTQKQVLFSMPMLLFLGVVHIFNTKK
jgi:hypothetical protein